MLAFIGVASLTVPGAMAHSRGGVAPDDERAHPELRPDGDVEVHQPLRLSMDGRSEGAGAGGLRRVGDARRRRRWEARVDVVAARANEMRGRVVAFVIAGAVAVGGVGSRSASSGTSAGHPRPRRARPAMALLRSRRRASRAIADTVAGAPRRAERPGGPGPGAARGSHRHRGRRGARARRLVPARAGARARDRPGAGGGLGRGKDERDRAGRRTLARRAGRAPLDGGGRDPPRPRRAARGRAVERAVRGGALRSGCDRDRSLTLRGAADRDPRGLPHLRGQPRIGCQRAGSHPRLERGGGPGRRAHRGGVGAVRG